MKTILLAGASGFVGSWVKKSNEFKKHCIIEASRRNGTDLADPLTISKLSPANIVVHLAANVGIDKGEADPANTIRHNVSITANLAEFCRIHNASMIYISSYLYGTPKHLPINEDHPIECLNSYACSKYLSEELIRFYHLRYGVPCVILRPFNIYGSGQSEDFIIGKLIATSKRSSRVFLKNLNIRRDYLHVSDLIAAIHSVIKSNITGLQTFNVASGKGLSVNELIDLINRVSKQTLNYDMQSEDSISQFQIGDCWGDASKFRTNYQWAPKISMEEGLLEMLNDC